MDPNLADSVDLGALNWTAIVAAAVFVSAQVFGVSSAYLARRRSRQNLAKALLAEIIALHEHTTQNATEFTVEKAELLAPVLKSYDSNFVYKANVQNIGLFPKSIVSDIVKLYHISTSIDSTVDVISKDGFKECEDLVKNVVVKSLNVRRAEQKKLAGNVSQALRKYVA